MNLNPAVEVLEPRMYTDEHGLMTKPAETRRGGASPFQWVLVLAAVLGACPLATEASPPGLWRDEVLAFPYTQEALPGPHLQLLGNFPITIADGHRSELLVYRQAGRPSSRPAPAKPTP